MLAINTAFMTTNLALKTDNKTVLRELDSSCKHSENVLKTIDEMCQEAQIDILDEKVVAVVTGPGSFTGLRIGVSIAKALGCANKNLKFISMSSLDFMAYIVSKNNLCQGEFVCALNALSNLFFVSTYDKDGTKTQNEKMIEKSAFEEIKSPIFVLDGDLKSDSDHTISMTSKDLLEYALKLENAGLFTSEKDLLPVYLRASQAEDNLSKKDKKV